jgi:hypothetical protein
MRVIGLPLHDYGSKFSRWGEGLDALLMSKTGKLLAPSRQDESLFFTFAPLRLAREHSLEWQL